MDVFLLSRFRLEEIGSSYKVKYFYKKEIKSIVMLQMNRTCPLGRIWKAELIGNRTAKFLAELVKKSTKTKRLKMTIWPNNELV